MGITGDGRLCSFFRSLLLSSVPSFYLRRACASLDTRSRSFSDGRWLQFFFSSNGRALARPGSWGNGQLLFLGWEKSVSVSVLSPALPTASRQLRGGTGGQPGSSPAPSQGALGRALHVVTPAGTCSLHLGGARAPLVHPASAVAEGPLGTVVLPTVQREAALPPGRGSPALVGVGKGLFS